MRPYSLHVQKLLHFRRSFVRDRRLHVQPLRSRLYTQAVVGAFSNVSCICPIKLFIYQVTSGPD